MPQAGYIDNVSFVARLLSIVKVAIRHDWPKPSIGDFLLAVLDRCNLGTQVSQAK